MKVASAVAKKRRFVRPEVRATLTLPASIHAKIEALREGRPRSAFVGDLVEREWERRERDIFLKELRGQYTPSVCEETLRINEAFPVHEE